MAPICFIHTHTLAHAHTLMHTRVQCVCVSVRICHITYMNESCHTLECRWHRFASDRACVVCVCVCVCVCVWMSFAAQMSGTRHTHECRWHRSASDRACVCVYMYVCVCMRHATEMNESCLCTCVCLYVLACLYMHHQGITVKSRLTREQGKIVHQCVRVYFTPPKKVYHVCAHGHIHVSTHADTEPTGSDKRCKN